MGRPEPTGEGTVSAHPPNDRALLVAIPARHLEAALIVCEERGVVTLPAGGPGDLDGCEPGLPVLVIATEAEAGQVPAATWRAVFDGRVPHQPGDLWPDGLPSTWSDEHAHEAIAGADEEEEEEEDDEEEEEEDEEDEEDERIGPQSFFRVRDLKPSARGDWIYANELVPKQQREGRTFVPRTPRLIRLVD
jgi:hypothetical protein